MPLRNTVKTKWIPLVLSVLLFLSFSACSSCGDNHESNPVSSDSDSSTISTEPIDILQESTTATESESETRTESAEATATESESTASTEVRTYNDYGEWDPQ